MGVKPEEVFFEIHNTEEKLRTLRAQYNEVIREERKQVLGQKKSKPMSKTKYLLGFRFASSSQRTKQYLEFHRIFKLEFGRLLKPFISEIKFSKPNHFDVTGFFKLLNGQIYYFSLGDLRWNGDSLLYRTAQSFEDYGGGSNQYIAMSEIENLPKKERW